MREIGIAAARRVALAAQGFADPRPTGKVTLRHMRRVIDRVGVVQIDSVNIVARAHYLPFFARLGNYPTGLLNGMAWGKQRELIEYWAHMAALIPVEDWPLFRHRMDGWGMFRAVATYLEENPGALDEIRNRIRSEGAIRPAALEKHHATGLGPWWEWSFAKSALEYLFFKGEVTIPNRINFARTYDLTERILPAEILNRSLAEPEQRRELLRKSLRHLGVATFSDLTDYYRQANAPCRPIVKEMVADGEAMEVRVEGWKDNAYFDPEASIPRTINGVAFLCPFDPVVWYPPRTDRLFDFHSRIEIYTPQPKRIFGYYVFPVLFDGELVGRLDLKADRAASALLVRGSHVEKGQDPERLAPRINEELQTMAEWLQLDDVVIEPIGGLAGALAKAQPAKVSAASWDR
ncbi:MAG: winged helix-turn-helix domain-containing protein [Acidimicrobiia bacterium]